MKSRNCPPKRKGSFGENPHISCAFGCNRLLREGTSNYNITISFQELHMPLAAAFQENFNIPRGQHTPDPRFSVYEGDPFITFIVLFWCTWGTRWPGVCWNCLRSIQPFETAGGELPRIIHPINASQTSCHPQIISNRPLRSWKGTNIQSKHLGKLRKIETYQHLGWKGNPKKDFPEKEDIQVLVLKMLVLEGLFTLPPIIMEVKKNHPSNSN